MHAMKQGLAASLMAALILLAGAVPRAAMAQQAKPAAVSPATPVQTAPAANRTSAEPRQLPDSPGASASLSAQQIPPPPAPGQASPSQPAQTPAARPPGTAAAEISNTGGVTASEPAGIAVAPAKQRRLRSWIIKLGAVAGAGVAVGTALALSQASPSKPPGAH